MSACIKCCGCVLLLVCVCGSYAMANDAVSVTNFKAEGLYGNVDSQTAKGIGTSVSVPVGEDFGLQIDGLAGEINPEDFAGVGLHAFWRRRGLGLLGLTASHTELADVDASRVGVEGEYYLDRFALAAHGGYQDGDIDESGFGMFEGRYYPIGDLMLSAGMALSDGHERYGLGAEYQTPVEGLSVFASLATGEDDYDHAFIGLRFYFGGAHKPLIRRHREDDPANHLFENILNTFVAFPSASDAPDGVGPGGDI